MCLPWHWQWEQTAIKHLPKNSNIQALLENCLRQLFILAWRELSVGCGREAAISSAAAVNSFPDLEFSSPRLGPNTGPLSSSRRQVLPPEFMILPLRPTVASSFALLAIHLTCPYPASPVWWLLTSFPLQVGILLIWARLMRPRPQLQFCQLIPCCPGPVTSPEFCLNHYSGTKPWMPLISPRQSFPGKKALKSLL